MKMTMIIFVFCNMRKLSDNGYYENDYENDNNIHNGNATVKSI